MGSPHQHRQRNQRDVNGFPSQWSVTKLTLACSYEENLMGLMYQYSTNPWVTHLDELEVFVGNIIGTNHNLTKRQREASSSMRDGMRHLIP